MTRLLIDTDVALGAVHEGRPRDVDDGFAMLEAINADTLELVGVTTVYGNAPLDTVHAIANEIVTLKHSEIPVHRGAEAALPAEGPLPTPNAACRFLADALSTSRASIAAIGPLTNIGLLAHHFPEAMASVDVMIIVAGRSPGAEFYIGDAGPVRDFNFENDVRAAQLVMASGVPLVLAGFELTSQVVITERDLQTIAGNPSEAAQYCYRNSIAWCRHWVEQFPADAGFHPWDSAAIAWLEHPERFLHERRGWRIRALDEKTHWLECGAELPGTRVTYCTGFTPGGREAFVADVVAGVH